ncbi:GNAT family N-acetyltransferase [Pedobacter gandavensis]|uniref:GNAT family N-acetyltransferase n=1 Tax=Pedobacter gandavensis TaxID=2679963 RepID=UPI00292E8D48|nr:GNAT family N-acetyltransferase [Pedobacter gandavensis]
MIKSYISSDFDTIASWVTDEDLLLQFAGTDFSFPLTRKQLEDYQISHPDRCFYIGYLIDQVPFAFGEIIPQEGGTPRLARILIGEPSRRSQGLGRHFIGLLLEEIRLHYHSSTVDLYVWEKNDAAIKCYESVGFILCPERAMTMLHKDRSYHIHKMTYTAGFSV